jgi:DNA repair ATPase RecN
MPGRVQNGRKRPSIAVSDDDEENSDYPSSVSVGSKRARHTRDASESPIRFQGHGNRHSRANGDASETYVEGAFPPGALVRVKLKNFVTYTAAEFHLGPSLNMIIGPNGTGKSTLVCAICLGLGWSSEHLGRAKETGLFVKNGSTEAEIEIELAAERAKDGEPQQPNPIVRRIIRRDDNKTVFFIDGKPVGKRAVLALCERFSIQIDNLCQFLPQDRVVEFARMGPVDRLRETQRAAAPPYMVEWHEQLKALRVEQRGHARQHQEKKNDLESLEKAQARDRPDVERIHQREGLMQRAKCLRKVKPIIELNLRKEAVTQAKKDAILARRELDQLTADVAPLQEAKAEAETYMNQIVQVVAHRKNRVNMMKTQAEKFFTRIEKEKQAVTGLTGEISGEASSKKVRERDMARMKADIAKLERQKQEKPVDFDAGAYSSRLNELRSQRSAASARHTEKKDVYQQLKLQGHNLNQENRSLNEQRQQLDTQGGKQAGVLVQISRDTAKAWEWFQKNRGSLNLKGEVHGPPILECSIPDPRYASAVESQLRKGELVGITCTNGDDQKFLSDRFLSKPDEGGLGLHDVHLRTSSKPRSNYQPPVASADLPSLGFQSYIIDHIQGPDAVLAMLCDNKSLHKIAYTSGPITDEQTATVSSSRIQKWVSGTTISQITTRKEYGASSTAVTQLSPARCFVDQPVNTEKMRQLEDALKRVQREGQELRENVETIKQELKDVEQEIDKVKVEIVGHLLQMMICH